jgi:hypothetical protein
MMGKKGVSRPEAILYKGIKGLEMLRDSGGYFYRVRLLSNGSQMVMTMVES